MEDSIDPLQDVSADREQFADAAESLKLDLKKAHFDFQVPGCFSISSWTTIIKHFIDALVWVDEQHLSHIL